MVRHSHVGCALVLFGAIAAMGAALPAMANPKGGQVVGGSATIQGQGTAGVIINQSTQSAIINWQSFNIGVGESTHFNQPSASSTALNRVTRDKNPSSIFGSLSANGRVFLVNPEGFIFGPSASINTAGFLATTHDIKNEDFLAGRYNFNLSGNPKASIVNQGTITVTDAGIGALVAPAVRNDGVIAARLGKVALASANAFTLDLYGDNLIKFALNDQIASQVIDATTGKPVKSLVENRGRLNADGGTVLLTAVTARALVNSVINNSGVVEARSVGRQNGKIVLGAQTARTKRASAPTQTVTVSGRLDASGKDEGETGGKAQITGEAIVLAGTIIDVSGHDGGGTALIGGDVSGGKVNPALATNPKAAHEATAVPTATEVTVDAESIIDASATNSGDGGKVIVWSDGATAFFGTVAARGGANAGDGGFVETSGREKLAYGGKVDLSAPKGEVGTLLLDPTDVTIGSSGSWIITVAALQAALATNNVIVNTSAPGTDAGDITVAESFSWASANKLTFSANRHITVLDGVVIANTGAGSLSMRADDTGSGVGRVFFNGSGRVDFSGSTGTVSIFYNPTWFSVPIFGEPPGGPPRGPHIVPIQVNYSSMVLTNPSVANQLTAYMLVNDIDHLQYLQNQFLQRPLTGSFALGRDIDASATASWNGGAGFVPIGNQTTPFTGVFDGQGHTIDRLTINSSSDLVGLFGYVSSGGIIRDVNLTNATVTSLVGTHVSNGTFVPVHVGALVAYNAGTVADSSVIGIVNGSFDADVGGLVGLNEGTILRSSATAAVTAASPLALGDLVGRNSLQGTISQSYANGVVQYSGSDQAMIALGFGSVGPAVGGLVGHNQGTIAQSYSMTAVGYSGVGQFFAAGIGQTVAQVGGLVGLNFVGGTLTQTYAAGGTSGGPSIETGGLLGYNSAGFLPGTNTQVPSTVGITNSYWDTQSTGQSTSAGGTGLTTAQLKAGLPAGFNTAVWGQSPSVNVGYPHLLWQVAVAPSAIALAGGPSGTTPITLFYLADPASNDYGTSLPPLTGTVIGFVNGDTLETATTGTLVFTTTATSSSNVGNYAITGSGLSAIGNYLFAQAGGNATALTITPAPLTISANNASKVAGEPNPVFTASFGGLVLGQTSSVVSGLVLTTPATTASASGTYPIVPSGATAPNYVISYVNGVLTVTPAPESPSAVCIVACAQFLQPIDFTQISLAMPSPPVVSLSELNTGTPQGVASGITGATLAKLEMVLNTPSAWLRAGDLYELVVLIAKIQSYSDFDKLILTLQRLGIYDPTTMVQLRNQLLGKAVTEYGLGLLYDAVVEKAISNFEHQGLVKDSNQWLNRAVLKSLAATAFNLVTFNLPGQIIDQTFRVASEAVALRNESNSVVDAFVQQGAGIIQAWAKAKSLALSGAPGSNDQANNIRKAVSSSIDATSVIMSDLAKGSYIPLQTTAANKWSIVAAILNAKNYEMLGNEAAAKEVLAVAKELAIAFDKAEGTYNRPGFPLNNHYQDFASAIATSPAYNLSGW